MGRAASIYPDRGVSGWRKHLPWVAAVLACAGFIGLGIWQLDRARQKEALLAAYAAGAGAPPLALEGYQAQPRYTSVRISGRYLDYTVLLDNQIVKRRPGVHLYTLFEPAAGPPRLLVNRGWLPLDPDRRVRGGIPDPPAGPLELEGLLSEYPRPGIRLGTVDFEGPAPALVPYLERDALAAALKTELAPQILLLTEGPGPDDKRLVRDFSPAVMPPERHRAYAFQWFSLAAAVAVVFSVLRFRRRS